MAGHIFAAGEGALWIKRDASPSKDYEYLQGGGAGALSAGGAGAVTAYNERSDTDVRTFVEVGRTRAAGGRASGSANMYFKDGQSIVENLTYPFHVAVPYKSKGSPTDPLEWSRRLVWLFCDEGNLANSDPGVARTQDQDTPIVRTFDWSAPHMYEQLNMSVSRLTTSDAGSALSVEVARKTNRDPRQGKITQIGDTVWVGSTTGKVIKGVRGSTGTYTFTATAADPFTTDDVVAILDMGTRVIAIDGIAAAKLAYTDDGGATWTAVTGSGAKILKHAVHVGWYVWAVAEDGYIYRSIDGGATITGAAVSGITDDFARIDMLSTLTGYAVGAANAMAKATDGATWTSITGPDVGQDLTCVDAIEDTQIVWVGSADGKAWESEDGGSTWTQSRFTADGTGSVKDIQFFNAEDGLLIHEVSGAAKIYRTVNGGKSWNYSPNSGIGATPTNAGLTMLKWSKDNEFFAVGAVATTAMILRGAAA